MLLAATTVLTLMLLIQPAGAGRLWCTSDPVIRLDQRLVSFSVAILLEDGALVSGPTAIDIKVPPAIDGALIVNDVGFMGHGTVVTFLEGAGASKDDSFVVEGG